MYMENVTEILHEAAATAILPRYQALAAGEITEKSPGELVTVADREAEQLITRRLRELLDAPVVGEEATAADPGLLRALREAPAAWVVDPLDGTANFVAGRPEYAVQAALVRDGRTVACWIVQPALGQEFTAELGGGAWSSGVRLHREPAPAEPEQIRGAALTKYLDPAIREHVETVRSHFALVESGAKAAGVDYPRLLTGAVDFLRYQRTLPWDHAPGALLATEAGAVAQRLDGSPYRPDDDRTGLLVAADPACWTRVLELITPPAAGA
ncbi:fructose-1,6-bisphosphatase/inositol monophosphatase family enzyme [Kitasatospora sp. GP30]|uniref:inositol monophosphatase family protein n=1 Tax=Kitasatospora sp. GP30 TaxID=3035084 RepID=UPI000C7158FC|nr:inositol monophosphatase [Kitasatospora sp. GP30]MDH6140509.1 fructose-1,6-bisphosphatase/inositol monophosphatase family enzyme [Kitasatospora sp. GP30]